jgi:hypothetical protein
MRIPWLSVSSKAEDGDLFLSTVSATENRTSSTGDETDMESNISDWEGEKQATRKGVSWYAQFRGFHARRAAFWTLSLRLGIATQVEFPEDRTF